MKKLFQRFNLIEIILAMGVIAIGMAGVMAMLAPSLNANRDAVGDAVAAEAVTKMIAYIDMKSSANNASASAWTSAMDTIFVTDNSKTGKEILGAVKPEDVDVSGKTKLNAPFDQFAKISGNTPESVYTYVDSITSEPLVNVIVRKVPLPAIRNYTADNANADVNASARPGYRFYIEASWPADAPADADNRQYRYFVYEVLCPYHWQTN